MALVMAVTSYGTNDPLAVKLWSKRLAVEVLKSTWAIQVHGHDLGLDHPDQGRAEKSAGDKITYGLRMQLVRQRRPRRRHAGRPGRVLTTYSDSVRQPAAPCRPLGRRMSQQRVPFVVRDEALSGLRDWWSDRIDAWPSSTRSAATRCRPTPATPACRPRWRRTPTTTRQLRRVDGDESITTTSTFVLSFSTRRWSAPGP
jgi:hypothetical protein